MLLVTLHTHRVCYVSYKEMIHNLFIQPNVCTLAREKSKNTENALVHSLTTKYNEHSPKKKRKINNHSWKLTYIEKSP